MLSVTIITFLLSGINNNTPSILPTKIKYFFQRLSKVHTKSFSSQSKLTMPPSIPDITIKDFYIFCRFFNFPNNISTQSTVTMGKSSKSNCNCSYKTSFPSINVFVVREALYHKTHNKNRGSREDMNPI